MAENDETARRRSKKTRRQSGHLAGAKRLFSIKENWCLPKVRAVLGYLATSPCCQPALSSAPRLAHSIQTLQLSGCLRQSFSEASSLLSTSIYIGFLVALAAFCFPAARESWLSRLPTWSSASSNTLLLAVYLLREIPPADWVSFFPSQSSPNSNNKSTNNHGYNTLKRTITTLNMTTITRMVGGIQYQTQVCSF